MVISNESHLKDPKRISRGTPPPQDSVKESWGQNPVNVSYLHGEEAFIGDDEAHVIG